MILKRETFGEMFRFAVVGTISTVLNYVIYWILQHWINVNVAYTIGYVLSFFVISLLRPSHRKKFSSPMCRK